MIARLKLYFDNCCSRRLPGEILAEKALECPGLEVRHLTEDHIPSSEAPDWIPKIKAGAWVIVTCDRGRDRKTQPLPQICAQEGVTNVVFSSTLLHKGPLAQKSALLAVWNDLLWMLPESPRGTQIRLGESGTTNSGVTRYKCRPVPPDEVLKKQ